eukprot:5785930-Pleurochrysis_carterae.AAC.1
MRSHSHAHARPCARAASHTRVSTCSASTHTWSDDVGKANPPNVVHNDRAPLSATLDLFVAPFLERSLAL